jgi:hypothetical protein
LGCLHRADFEDFVMDPDFGLHQTAHFTDRGKLIQETVNKFVIGNPYDFTKFIPNNPDYEGYNHRDLQFT